MNEIEIVQELSKRLLEKFNGLIRVIAIFGSYAKGKATEKSDIDVIVIVDDVNTIWNDVVRSWYKEEVAKILSSKDEFKRIHLNTITLSTFWDMLRIGDPLAISILRDSIVIVDSLGLFKTMQGLLRLGKIYPSKEAIEFIIQRLPIHFRAYKFYTLKALEALYWIFVESAQVYLMTKGYAPSPEEIPKLLEKDENVPKIYVKWYKEIYNLVHKIVHGEVTEISPDTLETWRERAYKFYEKMLELASKV